MLSNRPYLLRAFYQWIVDSQCTPILVIDAHHPRCKIPMDYAEGGEIVFNISPTAVRDLQMHNDFIEFKASFSGVIHFISAPVKAVLAVYAEENGEGLFFDAEEDNEADEPENSDFKKIDELALGSGSEPELVSTETATKAKPFLKLVE